MINIGLNNIAEITAAISHYNELGNGFPQHFPDSNEVKTVYDWLIKTYSKEKKWYDEWCHGYWLNIDFHYVQQGWSNTSCGWESMGGAAMRSAYTLIITNDYTQLAFIYYNGKLAYIAKIDDKWMKFEKDGFRKLPGHRSAVAHLNVIHRTKF